MTPENLLKFIENQVELLTSPFNTDPNGADAVTAVLTECFEKLVDMEMNLDNVNEQA